MHPIYLFSSKNDVSTHKVISWLGNHPNAKRINAEDYPQITYSDAQNLVLKVKNEEISIENTAKIWLRRGFYTFTPEEQNQILNEESKRIQNFCLTLLEKRKNTIGSLLGEYEHNKLLDLQMAEEYGLTIPKTLILTSAKDLPNNNKKWITKAIYNFKVVYLDENTYFNWGSPSVILAEKLNENATFYPSLVQEYIEKEYELRIFYLLGEFYAMAIFSQLDEQTKLDFRNYNHDNPNRNVPFKLPLEVENKLTQFLNYLNLNCCSIDMIVTPQNEFVFLEINRVGQFDWLSINCNYYLEEKIAKFLKDETTNH